MIFTNDKGDVLHSISDVMLIHCESQDCALCRIDECNGSNKSCSEWCINLPEEAALLMGWEVVEDTHVPESTKKIDTDERKENAMTEREITPGLYRHFKGKSYRVLDIATHSEAGEKLVVYQQMYDKCEVYVRPLEM